MRWSKAEPLILKSMVWSFTIAFVVLATGAMFELERVYLVGRAAMMLVGLYFAAIWLVFIVTTINGGLPKFRGRPLVMALVTLQR